MTSSQAAGIAERLTVEFEGRQDAAVVAAVVQQAERDLAGAPAGAMEELVERCARQRLLDRG